MKSPAPRVQSRKYPGNLAEARKKNLEIDAEDSPITKFSHTQAHLIFKMGHVRTF